MGGRVFGCFWMAKNMEIEYQNLTKKDRRELRSKEKVRERTRTLKGKTARKVLIWTLVVLGVGGGIFGITKFASSPTNQAEFDVTKECVTHGRLGMHIHPYLNIFIDGKKQKIPANIGIASSSCFRPIHTHDASGELHIEWRTVRDFTLGEFFQVWDKPFNSEQILEYKVDETHTLTVTVNVVANEEYENLILRDNDQVIINYETKR